MKISNIVIGLFLLALSVFYYLSTRDLPPPSKTENLGSTFFPILLAVLLALLSIMLILGGLLSHRSSGHHEEKAAISGGERLEEDSFAAEGISYKFLFGTIGLSIFYVILLPIIGYIIITPIFLIAMIRLLGKKKWVHNIAISILLTVSLYLLFGKMLGVALPPGLFLE